MYGISGANARQKLPIGTEGGSLRSGWEKTKSPGLLAITPRATPKPKRYDVTWIYVLLSRLDAEMLPKLTLLRRPLASVMNGAGQPPSGLAAIRSQKFVRW